MKKNASLPTKPSAESLPTFNSFDLLAKHFAKVKTVRTTCPLTGAPLVFSIRALNSDESDEAERLTSSLIPPMKKVVTGTGANMRSDEEYDFADPKFRKEMEIAVRQKEELVVLTGIVGIEIPGSTLIEKGKKLRGTLPRSVIDFLYREIMQISGGTLEVLQTANFTTGDPSDGSPS